MFKKQNKLRRIVDRFFCIRHAAKLYFGDVWNREELSFNEKDNPILTTKVDLKGMKGGINGRAGCVGSVLSFLSFLHE